MIPRVLIVHKNSFLFSLFYWQVAFSIGRYFMCLLVSEFKISGQVEICNSHANEVYACIRVALSY